jgi:hypothetical protein
VSEESEPKMDPYDYPDLTHRLHEQLPRALRERLKVWVLPGTFGELPTAVYQEGDRDVRLQVQGNGLISETDLAQLCVAF